MDDFTANHGSLSKEGLKTLFIGKELDQIPTPAAVVDRAVVRRNCRQMLMACDALGVSFRPHIKTHKVIHFELFLPDLNVDFSHTIIWCCQRLKAGLFGLQVTNFRWQDNRGYSDASWRQRQEYKHYCFYCR